MGVRVRAKITQIFEFTGLGTALTDTAVAGNIVGFAGVEEIDIGDTLTADEAEHAPSPSPRSIPRPSRWSFASTTGRSSAAKAN